MYERDTSYYKMNRIYVFAFSFPEYLSLSLSCTGMTGTEYNLPGGETGFDAQETKLPTYWNTPFSKICLGMKIGQQINFIVINKQANSLYSLIADGQYRKPPHWVVARGRR